MKKLEMQDYCDKFKESESPPSMSTRLSSTKLPRNRHVVPPHNLTDETALGGTSFGTPKRQSPAHPAVDPTSTSALLRKNQELRQRLADETNSYRRRIDTYKQAQQNQATLVSRLQSKIQQYRQRCSDLEDRMQDTMKTSFSSQSPPKTSTGGVAASSNVMCTTSLPYGQSSLPCTSSLESGGSPPCTRDCLAHEDGADLCRKLEDEYNRREQLATQNTALRQQLQESNRTNEALTNDLQKLTNDWSNLRDELMLKEDEYKEEEQAFKDYYNNEYNRLVSLWREVAAVKRTFKDMQQATKNELTKMSNEVQNVNRDVPATCNNISFALQHMHKDMEDELLQAKRSNDELQKQLATLRVQQEATKHEVVERDHRLQDVMNQMKQLETRCAQAESQVAFVNRSNEEIERLNAAIREIAQAVVHDAEHTADHTNNAETSSQYTAHESRTKSPHRGATRTPQAFAEGTISAVQAALHKYQLALHDLQVKAQTTNDQLRTTEARLKSSDDTKHMLTSKMQQLTELLDTSNSKLSELLKERDSLQKSLHDVRAQKQHIEQGKAEINTAFELLSGDFEKLQLNHGQLQKKIDVLEEEKKALGMEIQRIFKDKNLIEMNLRSEVDRGSRLREETISLREELNRMLLKNDLLEQQHIESENAFNLMEKQKADLEYDMQKLLLEHCDLQDRLEKINANSSCTSDELKSVQNALTELQEERNKFKQQSLEQSQELEEIKKVLSGEEKIRLELETENMSFSEKIKCLQMEKDKILQDLACVTRDRSDIHNKLTALCRKKETINEELMRTRQRLEQTSETNNRLNRNLEEMVKNVEEKQVIIDMHEKEIHRLQELLAALRSEKESLDAVLFDTNSTLEATEEKRNQLERELQEALVREESLKNQTVRLQKELETCQRRAQETKTQLTQAARAVEQKLNQQIQVLKNAAEETAKKNAEELNHVRNVLEKRMQQALQALQTAKDDEIEKLQERINALQTHLENVIQQQEEAMIRAENDKQQALLIAAHDKQAVCEKLEAVARDYKAEQDEADRFKREANAKDEKQRNIIAHLKDELVNQRTKEEENKVKLEEALRKQEIHLIALKEERDNLVRLSEELKTEIRLKEDKMEGINIELQDALRKTKENEGYIDGLRKENTDVKRSLADSNIEKDKYSSSNKELRDHIKYVEGAKREQARALEESSQKIALLEETKSTLENERTRLSTILKECENNLSKTKQELNSSKNSLQKLQMENAQKSEGGKELQNKLTAEIEAKERSLQEVACLKKQIADLETNLCAIRQELGRARCHANQEENRFHAREEELVKRFEESRGREKRLEDQKHNLEVCLADATQQIQELKARLGGAESRIRALDEQLSHCELHRRDTEQKLSSVAHTLRRIAGIQLDGTVNLSQRLVSPSRRFSPVRSCHEYDTRSATSQGQDVTLDVDPDLVRKGVRNLMHQVGHIEREKDDYKMQLAAAKKQIHDAAEQQSRCDHRIAKLQQMLRQLQQEKSELEADKNMKVTALQCLEDQLKQKSNEAQQLRENVTQLEMQYATSQEENAGKDDRLEKCRHQLGNLEHEKRQLQEDLAKVENRATKLDLQRVSLEGELSRLQMALKEKDCQIRQTHERLENQNRSIQHLEDRCTSLKTTVDQLKERLQKSTVTETELRGEIKTLTRELSEQGHCTQANEEKLKLMQKSLQSAENEKRILSERLDSSQVQLNELRRSQQAQLDNVQRLQEQVSDLEVKRSALESQLRIAKWNQESNDKGNCTCNGKGGGSGPDDQLNDKLKTMQREKTELRQKLNEMQEKLKQLENEQKRKYSSSEKLYQKGDNDSNRLEYGDNYYKSSQYSCGLDHSTIEQETRDLRLKVRRLESQLAEKETELVRCKARSNGASKYCEVDTERMKIAHTHAEKLIDARENAHKQQVMRLENQISLLREQLAQEARRRQQYILRSTKANREMQQLRSTLGDSLRHVAQHPLDADLLETESRRLDSAVSLSLPPSSYREYRQD